MRMFFEEDCAGAPVMHHQYDLRQDCFGWIRTVDADTAMDYDPSEKTRDNSAACFICYQGALCFREYTGVLSCENPDANGKLASWSTDKLLSTEECVLDGGNAYTQLQGGTEKCPPLPAGYDLQACHDELVKKCGHEGMKISCIGCCAGAEGCTNS